MDETETRLFALATNDTGIVKVLRELVSYVAILAIEAKQPGTVDPSEIDDALQGLDELHALLSRIGEFLPPIDQAPWSQ